MTIKETRLSRLQKYVNDLGLVPQDSSDLIEATRTTKDLSTGLNSRHKRRIDQVLFICEPDQLH